MCLPSTNRQHGFQRQEWFAVCVCLTKAFIAKVQELTSLVRHEGDEMAPGKKKTTNSHTVTRTDIQMAPRKDKHLLKSAFSVSFKCITTIIHTVQSGTVCLSAAHKLGPMMAVEDWFTAQNRPDCWGHYDIFSEGKLLNVRRATAVY